MNKLISRNLSAILLSAALLPAVSYADTTDGVVYKDKTKRFTVVADGLIRMEYAPDGKFNDDPSFVAYERQ